MKDYSIWARKRYVVTGGAGFIGSHLVDALQRRGAEVHVIDDYSLGHPWNNREEGVYIRKERPFQISQHQVDFSDLEAVKRVFRQIRPVEAIFHLGALPRVQYSIKEPLKTHNANVNGTLNMLLAAKEFDVPRFVSSSSSSVYGNQPTLPLKEEMIPNPLSPYALHKLIGEYYCEQFHRLYGVETVSLRYFNVFGPRQNPQGDYACLIPKVIHLLLQDKSITIHGDGEQTRDFTYVTDVVAANLAALDTNNKDAFGKAYNVGGGNQISVNDIYRRVQSILHKEGVKPIHAAPVIESRHTKADLSNIKASLNWEPKIPFDEGLTLTIEWIKEQLETHG